MPQSDASRPPEPSSPPTLDSNALAEPVLMPEDAPASDSEAETERLHDSPVKKRPSVDIDSPIGRATKRARHLESDPEASDSAKPELKISNGGQSFAPRNTLSNRAADKHKSESPDTRSPPDGPHVPETTSSSIPAVVLPAPEVGTEVPDPGADEEGSSLEVEDGAGVEEEEANEAAEIEDDEAGDAEDDDDDGNDGDNDDEDDENGDDEGGDDEDEENDEDRIQAISVLTEIEVEFAEFRDKLHDQQIARFDLEIQMCTKGVHPELEQYHLQIREEHEKRLHRSRALLAYQMRAIFNQSHAGRCQVHQTHLKSCHALRGELLSRVTRDWYQVNYERRAADRIVPDYGYVAQSRPHQIRRPTSRSMGIYYHTGIPLPAAPSMICANEDERDEDLRQLGLR